MIDLKATGNFIDPVIARISHITLQQKQELYKLSLADSEDIEYNNGQVNRETVPITIIMTRGYKEMIQFDIMLIREHQVILRILQLKQYNLYINQVKETLSFNQYSYTDTTLKLRRENITLGQNKIYITS